jgi:hypothetical protein
MHAFVIEGACSPKHGPSTSITVVRVGLSKCFEFPHQFVITSRSRLIQKGGTLELNKEARALNRKVFGEQEAHRITLLGDTQAFFASSSFKASTSSMRSASKRLRRLFSFSSSLRRCVLLTDMPP